MITHLLVNHYGCSYYCINEDSYIYMRSLIMKDKEKNDLLNSLFVLAISLFFSSFVITLIYLYLFIKIFIFLSKFIFIFEFY